MRQGKRVMGDVDATLFGFTAKTDIETAMGTVTVTPRITYDFRVTLDGQTFDAKDMLETLEAVADGDAFITDSRMIAVLKKIRVIRSGGSRDFPAQKDENFDLFRDLLEAKIESLLKI